MIEIYDKDNNLIASGNGQVSGEIVPATGRTWIIYVNYQQGSETGLRLNFEAYEKRIEDWFPLQVDLGGEIINYERNLTNGKYRIILPLGENEEGLKVIATFDGDTSNEGTARIWMIPSYVAY